MNEEIEEIIMQPMQPELPPYLFNFDDAKKQIDSIIGEWSTNHKEADIRKKERYIDIDINALRQSGDIDEDELFIPDRVIDTNIRREKADTMAFLNAGFRLGIFDCISNPQIDSRRLETEVTKGLTYKGWYKEFDRVDDCAKLHGLGYMEVVFDPSKPLHVGFEYIPYSKLYFNQKSETLQNSEFIIREYAIEPHRLKRSAEKFGFDQTQVDTILKSYEEGKRQNQIALFRVYFKYDNCVYIAWYCKESSIQQWLKAPQKLRLGIKNNSQSGLVEADIDAYPIFIYVYIEDEQDKLIEKKGRSFLDGPLQEANTAILSSYITSTVRASAIYASPENDDGESAEIKQLELTLVPNSIYNKPISFWNKPYPEPSALHAMQFLDTRNAQSSGKIATSVSNRKDARKTAQELEIAQSEQNKITSTSLATFSEFLREILTFSWRIIQSQAIQDKVKLLLIPVQQDPITQQWLFENDKYTIGQEFDIRPAGDTDVIEANQEQNKMMQDWPVIQTTPLKDKFLEDFIKLRYPKKAEEYIAILKQGNVGKALIAGLSGMLTATITPEEIGLLSPDKQIELQNLQAQVQQYLAQP